MSVRIEDIATRLAIEDVVTRMFGATDERNWPELESCFTDPLVLDMTSVAGGKPATMTPSQVAEAWADGFKALDHVHHQIGNFQIVVDGNEATVRCHGVAFHHRAQILNGFKTRVFVGTYELRLQVGAEAWLLNELKFNLKFTDGNLNLEKSW